MNAGALTPGQMSRAAAQRLPAKRAHVGLELEQRTNAQGLQELLQAGTGQVLAVCASPAIAKSTREFLS